MQVPRAAFSAALRRAIATGGAAGDRAMTGRFPREAVAVESRPSLLSRRHRRLLSLQCRRRLGDREPHRALDADGDVPVSDPGDGHRRLHRLARSCRRGGAAHRRRLAAGGLLPDRRPNSQRADHGARRRAHARRRVRGLLFLERRREPAHRAQPRLRTPGTPPLVVAAAGVDRLCAGQRHRTAGAGFSRRARPAGLPHGAGQSALARAARTPLQRRAGRRGGGRAGNRA